jgi:hypothetical protein
MLLQQRPEADMTRSLSPFGRINEHNVLATLIPPSGVPTPDTQLPERRVESLWTRAPDPRDLKVMPAEPEPASLLEVAAATGNTPLNLGRMSGAMSNPTFRPPGNRLDPQFVLPQAPFQDEKRFVPLPDAMSKFVITPPMGTVFADSLTPEKRTTPLFWPVRRCSLLARPHARAFSPLLLLLLSLPPSHAHTAGLRVGRPPHRPLRLPGRGERVQAAAARAPARALRRD